MALNLLKIVQDTRRAKLKARDKFTFAKFVCAKGFISKIKKAEAEENKLERLQKREKFNGTRFYSFHAKRSQKSRFIKNTDKFVKHWLARTETHWI